MKKLYFVFIFGTKKFVMSKWWKKYHLTKSRVHVSPYFMEKMLELHFALKKTIIFIIYIYARKIVYYSPHVTKSCLTSLGQLQTDASVCKWRYTDMDNSTFGSYSETEIRLPELQDLISEVETSIQFKDVIEPKKVKMTCKHFECMNYIFERSFFYLGLLALARPSWWINFHHISIWPWLLKIRAVFTTSILGIVKTRLKQ